MFRPSIGQFGIGWITAAGEPKLTPLPDQHLVPRHEGNPFASASLDTSSGSTWDGEWVFTEPVPTCSVAITNSAGATVRTLPCNATYAAMGEAMVSWNGTDTTGTTVPGGLYTWTVNAGDADGAAVNTDGTAGISGTIAVHNSAGPSGYHALTPARVLDTRPGQQTVDGLYAGVGAVGPAATVTVPVTGRAGIPATGVAAVAVNITGISPTTATYVTAYPAGAATPATSTLNLPAGAAYANGSIVKVGTGGAITLYNAVGTTDLAVDVLGYYPTDGTYVALTPARLTDTRPAATTVDGGAAATGAIPAGTSRAIPIAGRAGIPTTGVDAVVVNLTGINPTTTTYLTAYPGGATTPNTSTINLTPNGVTPNLAVVKLGPDGTINIYNAAGQTDIAVDVLGYIPTTTSYTPITPVRALDTRITGPAIGPATTRVLPLAGTNGIPADATAVVITLTGVEPTTATYLSAYPTGATTPTTSTLNLAPRDIRANTTYVKLGTNGAITLYNAAGTTPTLVDILGYTR